MGDKLDTAVVLGVVVLVLVFLVFGIYECIQQASVILSFAQ